LCCIHNNEKLTGPHAARTFDIAILNKQISERSKSVVYFAKDIVFDICWGNLQTHTPSVPLCRVGSWLKIFPYVTQVWWNVSGGKGGFATTPEFLKLIEP